MTRIFRAGIATAVVATFALSGCGSDKKASSDTAATATTAAATATTAAAETTAAGAATTAAAGSTPAAGGEAIMIKSFKYVVPEGLKAGAEVTITNADSAKHTFTDKGGTFDVAVDANNGTATLTLPAAGTYQLICKIHPSMSGTLTVV